jgi:hypothetical protein
LDDESDARKFQFVFYCDCCGEKYRASPILFSVLNTPDHFENFTAAQKLIWEAEHDDAYERAHQHALLDFTACKVCGRMICEDCATPYQHPVCPDCREKK